MAWPQRGIGCFVVGRAVRGESRRRHQPSPTSSTGSSTVTVRSRRPRPVRGCGRRRRDRSAVPGAPGDQDRDVRFSRPLTCGAPAGEASSKCRYPERCSGHAMSESRRPVTRGSTLGGASSMCRSWRTRISRDVISELAPVPHRVLDGDAFVERRSSGNPLLARRRWAAFQPEFRESARVLQGAWWVRSSSGPWSHSLPTTWPRFELITGCDDRRGRRVRLTSP
jgi:hypothetical protein